jgi:hypothetical protein
MTNEKFEAELRVRERDELKAALDASDDQHREALLLIEVLVGALDKCRALADQLPLGLAAEVFSALRRAGRLP